MTAAQAFGRPAAALSAFLVAIACVTTIAGCGGGSGGSSTPPNPAPSITALAPSSALAGGPAFTLTVSGSNFISSSTVEWNGSARPTTFASAASLQAAITAADIATGGTASVTVSTPAPGGGTSSPLTFTINNPVPTLTSISPSTLVAGSSAFTLTLTGANFVSKSIVLWNGSPRTTTFVSNTSLQAPISGPDIATPGTASVTVFNPTPGGGTSVPVTFIIQIPPPTITLMTPSSAVAGGAAFTVAISGTNFKPNSVVNWNGSPRTTTVLSDTSLQAAISASDIATIGAAKVTVVNAVADGGSSAFSSFFVGQAGGSNFAYVIVNQPAQDIVFDSVHNSFYLSAGSSASINPNTIRVLDPSTFTISTTIPQPAASNPKHLAISDDSQFLYAGLDGTGSIQRIALPSLKNDLTISLTAGASSPGSFADIQVAPGFPHTIAVVPNAATPGSGGIVIFDDGIARPTKVPGAQGATNVFNSIQWGFDATTIFAADLSDESFGFYSIAVNASGATVDHNFGSRFESFGNAIHFDRGSGLVYSDAGPTVDTNAVPSGAFAASGSAMVPDSKLGEAFFAGSDQVGVGVESFDITHFTPITSVDIPGVSGFPVRLIRWAQNGLAFVTNTGQVALLGGNFVSPAPPLTFNPPQFPVMPAAPAPNAPAVSTLAPSSAIAGSAPIPLVVLGSAFDVSATVQFNGADLPTTFVSNTKLTATIPANALVAPGTASVTVANPSPSGGLSAPSNFFIGTDGGTSQGGSSFAVTVLNQPVKDIKFDSLRNVLYLSVPGNAPNFANTIAVLDPKTATIIGEQYAGSLPNHLALSDDGQFLYVSTDGTNSVRRFTLPAFQPDINFGLGVDPTWGPYYALDLQVAPGTPHTTAISLGVTPIISPLAQGGLVIFDDAAPRPTKIPGFGHTTNLFDSLQWGADATSLFAANMEDTGNDFYVVSVSPGGATLTHDYSGLGNFETRIHYDRMTKLVYYDGGNVVDPSNGTNLTPFPNSGSAMVPDSNLNRAFFVAVAGPTTVVTSFDLTTRAQIDSITIPGLSGFFAVHLVRWGQNGLAFETDNNQLVLVGGSFVH